MEPLENEALQRMVNYSFGDHSGVLGGVPNAYMKKANSSNTEFLDRAHEFIGKTMTLFIDNIRLYKRPLEYSDWQHTKPISPQDRLWLNQFNDEDLLKLCSDVPAVTFVIFTAFEDTPLDDYIWGRIPPNVKAINAANGVILGEKIHPFPHGLERIMYPGYNHHELLREAMEREVGPTKLLLICHRDDTGTRGSIKDTFKDKPWATVAPHLEYEEYLRAIQDHKYVLCPSGNGIESARNWETLCLGRVPVFKRHPYLEKMFEGLPAVFVDDFSEVTEELLLSTKQPTLDRKLLDLNYWYAKNL